MKLNLNYDNLKDSYLFSTVARKAREYSAAHPDADIIKLSIGDVTLPLAPVVVQAMKAAADEMGDKAQFRGYGPEQGYAFLQEAIAAYYADEMQVTLAADEIFISDGAKSDLGNILDLFDADNTVLVPDPVYPVYIDTNVMAGRRIALMNATPESGFLAMPDDTVDADIIYLCSPNNPTGSVYSRAQLAEWIAYAKRKNAVILFDAAYECFVSDPALPRSIFEIAGARDCAIEFCSLSKTAGFTGTRCGYTVLPADLSGGKLNRMWLRRQTTKFNGVPYVVQRAAAAVFSPEGRRQVKVNIDYYRENARIIGDGLREMGIRFVGGENSPYIWMECPGGMDSWTFFDHLLQTANVVGTPGAGFGQNGTHYFRLTAFGDRERTREAINRMKKALK